MNQYIVIPTQYFDQSSSSVSHFFHSSVLNVDLPPYTSVNNLLKPTEVKGATKVRETSAVPTYCQTHTYIC